MVCGCLVVWDLLTGRVLGLDCCFVLEFVAERLRLVVILIWVVLINLLFVILRYYVVRVGY